MFVELSKDFVKYNTKTVQQRENRCQVGFCSAINTVLVRNCLILSQKMSKSAKFSSFVVHHAVYVQSKRDFIGRKSNIFNNERTSYAIRIFEEHVAAFCFRKRFSMTPNEARKIEKFQHLNVLKSEY